ncbi:hypothetical protein [Aureimonas phyllosphaerae]|uniref:Uncharacterized protein n=1 Tax=Aureimonas phyllosphaerae TaxID=1166078 RepID=A0A7W6FUX7_9HYPH|nr:hypothetical protein [Aureimonas phyllosphaerae]MBB3936225.1 hypothetical protein [Aureimonas phyllosphaerae]MBB3960050.1 hypothetical protein [Aureimonas phyllosphaerae]SFF32715.1 hypothetical protein SAMN05216566_10832 [Aureimonas phyllosphaerae]
MIRGHIDLATRSRVEGWIHCDRLALRGATVLAFHDDQCVGGGRVDLFRQDLADAGLGDGFVGFGFPVALAPGQDPRVLDVRLDGGTLLLKQGSSALAPREALTEDRRRQGRDPAALSWMLGRGWLAQAQHDALRGLARFGAHPLTLAVERRGRDARGVCDEVALHAAELLELYLQTAIDCEIRDEVRGHELPAIRSAVREAFPHAPPVIGLWATGDRRIDLVEGSHLGGEAAGAGAGLEYAFGGRTLLLLDLDATIGFRAGDAALPFTAFVPCRPEERR